MTAMYNLCNEFGNNNLERVDFMKKFSFAVDVVADELDRDSVVDTIRSVS